MKLFGYEPTLWIAVANAAVMLIGTFGLRFLDNEQAELIVVVINAIFAAINAWAVRPISPVVFTYAVGAILALAASYGFAVPPETVASLNAFVITVLALLARGQVTPQDTAVSKSTLDGESNDPIDESDLAPARG